MAPDPISQSARFLDLSPRVVASTTVVASPALAAETIVCQVTVPANLSIGSGVILNGWLAYTVGTSGTFATVRLRQTNAAGALIVSSGALTSHAAAAVVADDINGFDTAPVGAQVYVMTLQITAGGAASTVSAAFLTATAV